MKPTFAITMGDPAGVGAEVTVKALKNPALYESGIPVVIGDFVAVRDANDFCGAALDIHRIGHPSEALGRAGTLDLIDMGLLAPGSWHYGQVQAHCGKAAYAYVEKGIELALDGALDAVVTGPLNKEALHLGGYRYSGHTEIFADLTHTKDYAMLLATRALRVIHVTTHVSVRNACDRIKAERVLKVIRLAGEAMRLLGNGSPRIAVAGLNPHCSENGLFGWEEAQEILPAIEAARREGFRVEGPIPPDTVFVKALAGQYDIVLAMYHDQGHIPVKLSGFKLDPATGRFLSMSGVNITMGLPIIRTSVDHGTAFEIAGQGIANEESMVEAAEMALQMARMKKGNGS